jgi:hypothetical protein
MRTIHRPTSAAEQSCGVTPLEESQAALADTRALYEITGAMIGRYDLAEVLQLVADAVANSLPADRVTLIIFDMEAQKILDVVRGGAGVHHPLMPEAFDSRSARIPGAAET